MPRPPTPPPPPEVILAQALTLQAVRNQSFLDFLSDVLVEDAQKGNIPFELWPHLVDLATSFANNESYIILKARRLGVTWLIAAYVVWKAMTRPGANVIVISKTLDPDGYEFLAHCQFIWDNLPPKRKLRLRSSNLTKLEFISGGSIRVLAPTKDAGRSLSAAVVVVDEAAFHPYAAENYAGYKATTDNGGQVLMVSTSNGPSGFFYQMYQQAKASQLSSYRTRFIAWWYRPMRALRDHRENCGFQVHRQDCTCPLLLSPAGLPQPNYDWLAIEAQEYLSRPSSQGGGSSIDLSREYPATEDAAWTAASGLVYGLSEADGKMIFLATQHPEGNLSPDPTSFLNCRWRYAAVDYGGGDPTAILIAGKLPSGRVHVYNVFKRTGDVPVSEISNYLSSFDPNQTLFDAILCPKDGPNTTAELRHLGWPVYSARQARKEGITSTQQFLKSRRLTINPDTCEDLLREFESYYWQYRRDPSTGEKYATRTPHDHHGDLLDALRAVVMEIEASELTSYDLPDAIMKTR